MVLDGVTVLLPTVYDPSELRTDVTGKIVRCVRSFSPIKSTLNPAVYISASMADQKTNQTPNEPDNCNQQSPTTKPSPKRTRQSQPTESQTTNPHSYLTTTN